MSEDNRLNLEILGLLLQVAWADEEVASQEAAAIIGRARKLDIGDEHVELFEACLRGEKTLPPPNMGYLRDHRDQALAAVRALVYTDGVKTVDESEILAQIEEMLG
jgi:hypothetical protein